VALLLFISCFRYCCALACSYAHNFQPELVTE